MNEANYDGFSVIGRSPYATTYRAYSRRRRQVVVLKLYRDVRDSDLSQNEGGREGHPVDESNPHNGPDEQVTKHAEARIIGGAAGELLDEVRSWAGDPIPHFVAPLEAGTSALGEAYVARQRLSDDSLALRSGDVGQFDFSVLMWLGAQISDAVAALNERGIVHGAVSPTNIFVDRDLVAWLTDPLPAGARRLVPTGPMQRPGHIAPEVLAGGAATPVSDSYSIMSSISAALGHQPIPTDVAELIDAALSNDANSRPSPALLAEYFRDAAGAGRQRPLRHGRSSPDATIDATNDADTIPTHPHSEPIDATVADPTIDDPTADTPQPDAAQRDEPQPAERETPSGPEHESWSGGPSEMLPEPEQEPEPEPEPELVAVADVAGPTPHQVPGTALARVERQVALVVPIDELQADIIERNADQRRRQRRRRRAKLVAVAAGTTMLVGGVTAGGIALDRRFGESSTRLADGTTSGLQPAADPVVLDLERWFGTTAASGQRELVFSLSATSTNDEPVDLRAESGYGVAVLIGATRDDTTTDDVSRLVDLGLAPAELGLDRPDEPVASVRAAFGVAVPEAAGDRPGATQVTAEVPTGAELLGLAVLDNRNGVVAVIDASEWGPSTEPAALR